MRDKMKDIHATPEISIIMPLYNAEKYLKDSFDSIFHQTFGDFELICIDDASIDATLKVVTAYQYEDERVKVLRNQKRSGAACARNKGVKEAKGKYLIFLDGDDIFDMYMLEEAHKQAEDKHADVVIFEYKHVPSEKIYEKAVKFHGKEYINKYCKDIFCIKELEPYELLMLSASPCNKLLRRQFIVSNHIEFQSLPSANDVYFIYMAYFMAEKIILLNDSRIFLYARDHQVKTRISFNRNPMCVYQAMEELQSELIRRNIFGIYYQYFYCLCYWSLLTALKRTKIKEEEKNFYIFLQLEGIYRLCIRAAEWHKKLDKSLKNRMKKFECCEYESAWFRKDDIFNFYIEKNEERIKNLFWDYRKQKKLIAIWGAGKNGRVFLKYCNLFGLQVSAVIDKDSAKNGQDIQGYCVEMPESILDRIQVIIVIPQFIKKEVHKHIGDRQIEIIDINEFLCLV